MIKKELFQKTVNVLVKAYFDDTLRNASCCACAVGNLILSSNGLIPVKLTTGELEWPYDKLSYTYEEISWYDVVVKGKEPNHGIDNLNKTGYQWYDLRKIENAFELKNYNSNDRMFDNMMNVVDELMVIHQANQLEIKKAKSLFVKETA